ncbi:Alpha beta hydrolase fold-1 protein [Rutstroemia sp. NJR-2017a WRK4]|nr:Alpha beta hydrolase fold-1 protein [Rutstroemia sp. NJR-2017a WRK4]
MASFSVIICHGSYHTPEPYKVFQDALKTHGIDSYCPQLPSSDLTKLNVGNLAHPDYDRAPPSGGHPQPAEDVKVITALLKELVEKDGKNVILLGHSSGGFTATAAAVPEFQARERKKKGLKGGVVGIFYECAFLIPVGESVNSFFQPKDGSPAVVPPYCKFHKHGMNGVASTSEGAKFFFNGLPEKEAKHYESTLTASAVFTTVLENDAYTLPSVYLVTEDDLALPAAYQEGMIAMQNQRPGVEIAVVKCPSGHSPHLTWVDGFVREVEKFGQGLLKEL